MVLPLEDLTGYAGKSHDRVPIDWTDRTLPPLPRKSSMADHRQPVVRGQLNDQLEARYAFRFKLTMTTSVPS
jgi:hypothetical protein